MSDDDELGGLHKLLEHVDEAIDVRFVESRVDFVENAEGVGTAAEDC